MIVVTGGAGYIGSHCVLALHNSGYKVKIFDNLSTGHAETIDRLSKCADVEFVKGDLNNPEDLDRLFSGEKVSAVIHFAAFSQVGESMTEPAKYYRNNVCGTLNLLDKMLQYGVGRIVFSSTAATYGEPEYTPIDEKHPQRPINTYGRTKLMIENIMDDYDHAYGLKSVRLRYFNVASRCSEPIMKPGTEPVSVTTLMWRIWHAPIFLLLNIWKTAVKPSTSILEPVKAVLSEKFSVPVRKSPENQLQWMRNREEQGTLQC